MPVRIFSVVQFWGRMARKSGPEKPLTALSGPCSQEVWEGPRGCVEIGDRVPLELVFVGSISDRPEHTDAAGASDVGAIRLPANLGNSKSI